MLANAAYWQSVYASSAVPTHPSQFAVFVQSWLHSADATIIELGCGNGRDSRFFHGLGHEVVATDQVICDELIKFADNNERFSAVQSNIEDAAEALKDRVDFKKPLVMYSRFFQHAITEELQQAQLASFSKVLNKDSILFFEFRLDGDKDMPKEFGTTHYRRFQSHDNFIESLRENNFDCSYSCEGQGYARYKSEDPQVGRFVAKLQAKDHLRLV